jgi:hypothetical protein
MPGFVRRAIEAQNKGAGLGECGHTKASDLFESEGRDTMVLSKCL